MDQAKIQQSKKQNGFLAFLRILAGSLWIILWFSLFFNRNPYSEDRLQSILLYPGIVFFLFAADWTSRKVYGCQVRIACHEICHIVPSFDLDSDCGVLLLNDVVSNLCKTSLFRDKCGNNPYKDTWNSLYKVVSQRLYHAVFSQSPDNLSDDAIQLLKLFLGLGDYGISYGYLSPYDWDKKVHDLAQFIDVFENARNIIGLDSLPQYRNRARKVLYKDIQPQLLASFYSFENQYPSPVWDDIKASPYPFLPGTSSDIKRTFCSYETLTVSEYIFDFCSKWCNWHIKNYPTAFVYTEHQQVKSYTLKSSFADLLNVSAFLRGLPYSQNDIDVI